MYATVKKITPYTKIIDNGYEDYFSMDMLDFVGKKLRFKKHKCKNWFTDCLPEIQGGGFKWHRSWLNIAQKRK